MTDKVKLTKKALENLDQAKRMATGQSLDLNPRDRLVAAGLEFPNNSIDVTYAPHVVVSVSVEKNTGSLWSKGTGKGQTKSSYRLAVVDGEVMLWDWDRFAFGRHDGPLRINDNYGYRPTTYEQIPESEPGMLGNDPAKVAHKAQAVARALQEVLDERGEPVPDEREVERQQILIDVRALNGSTYALENTIKSLGKGQRPNTINLHEQAITLLDKVKHEADVLQAEAEALTS